MAGKKDNDLGRDKSKTLWLFTVLNGKRLHKD